MALGVTPRQPSLLTGTAAVCDGRVADGSIWALLAHQGDRLFPDELFADLYAEKNGRPSVPPRVVASVMVLQKFYGLSDRDAVEAFEFDARWKWAAGNLDFDYPGFAHTVLVSTRARLRNVGDENRIFNVSLGAAKAAGLVGLRRVLDSTPLYDAVATMDTVTLLGSSVRNLLRDADDALEAELRAALVGGDDYASAAKPQIDWDDQGARHALIDRVARDAMAVLGVLGGRTLGPVTDVNARLLASLVGQDLEVADDGAFRIARRVAPDRIISTVDPDARHGHKTAAHAFDGFKGHISEDPDSELITATVVTAGNVADGAVAAELVDELVDHEPPVLDAAAAGEEPARAEGPDSETVLDAGAPTPEAPEPQGKAVYGDCAYGTGKVLANLNAKRIDAVVKTPRPQAPDGHFTKDDFDVDLETDRVTCPAGVTVAIHFGKKEGQARFGKACAHCPLRARCTSSRNGRGVSVGFYESELAENRRRQVEPARAADYRATRPKVERKLGHLMRRRHGGRRARVRGLKRVAADFNLLAAAHNLARLAILGLHWDASNGWTAA